MKEYNFENGRATDLEKFRAEDIPFEEFSKFHQAKTIACHDVFIQHNGGILLVHRKRLPAKDIPWPLGGTINRGMKITDSLKKKAKEECGLEISDIKELEVARIFFETEPFGHGKGTDTINVAFFAKGAGSLNLDESHEKPLFIKKEDYIKEFKEALHPYVRDCMDKAINFLD